MQSNVKRRVTQFSLYCQRDYLGFTTLDMPDNNQSFHENFVYYDY